MFPVPATGAWPLDAVPIDSVQDAIAAHLPLPAGSAVTFEPGGQLELSSPPQADAAAACAALATDVAAVTAALEPAGVTLTVAGSDPLRPPARVMNTPRYRAMEAYFDAAGDHGRTMMCSTAALQVNVGLGPSDGVDARWRLAHAIGPTLVAAFANSPRLC